MIKYIKYLALFLFGVILLIPLLVEAKQTEIKWIIQSKSDNENAQFVIELSNQSKITEGKLSNPERFYLDFNNTVISKQLPKQFSVKNNYLKSIRLGQPSPDIARVVFDVNTDKYTVKVSDIKNNKISVEFVFNAQKTQPADKQISPEKDKAVIIPEVKPEVKLEVKPEAKPEVKPEAPKLNLPQSKVPFKKKIVLDPGHGGYDPGAVGYNGLYEKDVVLDVAIRAAKILEAKGYEVILTRDKDVFIPLEKRTEIANENKADLFISIHSNASTNKMARGIETYILNWTNDEESLKVAARENAISLKKMRQVQDELLIILASLERESKRNESINLAGYIQNSFSKSITSKYAEIKNLGVKQALFYVLVGAKMPSCLAEVSFISNPEEEKLLSDEAYRWILAESIVNGIDAYFGAITNSKS